LKRIVLEIVDVYRYEGFPEKRVRIRLVGTNIVFNVVADSVDEAVQKALKIVKHLRLERLVQQDSSASH